MEQQLLYKLSSKSTNQTLAEPWLNYLLGVFKLEEIFVEEIVHKSFLKTHVFYNNYYVLTSQKQPCNASLQCSTQPNFSAI